MFKCTFWTKFAATIREKYLQVLGCLSEYIFLLQFWFEQSVLTWIWWQILPTLQNPIWLNLQNGWILFIEVLSSETRGTSFNSYSIFKILISNSFLKEKKICGLSGRYCHHLLTNIERKSKILPKIFLRLFKKENFFGPTEKFQYL